MDLSLVLFICSNILVEAAKTLAYCDIYQTLTGIDVLSLMANNPAELETLLLVVVHVVNESLLSVSTEVFLSDSELMDLINYAVSVSGDGQVVSAQILRELGLFQNSIIAYILTLGYSIIA